MKRPDLEDIAVRALRAEEWQKKMGYQDDPADQDIKALLTYARHLEEMCDSLFAAIQHGDEQHKAWLRKAIDDHFSGKPVDRPEGMGSQERILHLEEENKRLRTTIEALETRRSWKAEAS